MFDPAEQIERLERDFAESERDAKNLVLGAVIGGALLLSGAMAIVAPQKYGHGWVAVLSFFLAAFACVLPMAIVAYLSAWVFGKFD
jgi:hypothetical protein